MAHLLDGCWAKIGRAEENINNLDLEIRAFLRREPPPYKIVGQHQSDGREYAFLAFGDPDVPPRFAVLAGEIVHHLRSSLDHLIHALIVRNGGSPSKNNQFPICTTAENFEKACNRGLIGDVSQSSKDLIRSVQPYTSPTPDDTVLYVVHQNDILDKHRLLVVVTTVAQIGQNITLGVDREVAAHPARQGKTPNIVGFGVPEPRKLSKDGVVIFSVSLAEPAPELVAKADFLPQIAFEKCGRAQLVPVVQTLAGLLAGTRHTLNLFAGEF